MHKYTVYIAELYGKLDSEKKERQGKKILNRFVCKQTLLALLRIIFIL